MCWLVQKYYHQVYSHFTPNCLAGKFDDKHISSKDIIHILKIIQQTKVYGILNIYKQQIYVEVIQHTIVKTKGDGLVAMSQVRV